MPIGIISNALVIIFGGIVGSLLGHKMSLEFKENMNMIFGAGAMTMGISSIMLMENLSAVIFSVVVGTAIGMAIHFGQWIAKGGEMMEKGIWKVYKEKGIEYFRGRISFYLNNHYCLILCKWNRNLWLNGLWNDRGFDHLNF